MAAFGSVLDSDEAVNFLALVTSSLTSRTADSARPDSFVSALIEGRGEVTKVVVHVEPDWRTRPTLGNGELLDDYRAIGGAATPSLGLSTNRIFCHCCPVERRTLGEYYLSVQ